MPPHAWIALLTSLALFVGMLRRNAPVEVLFVGGLVLVTVLGVLTPEQATAGFASKAVMTIGGLLVAAAALRTTGAIDWVGNRLLGPARTEREALLRLTLSVVPVSAVVINTPVVAMMAPAVVDWCRRRAISPSRLLIPLSYLAILGGVCTLIGTTTILVSNGVLPSLRASLQAEGVAQQYLHGVREMSFLEITWAGLPCAIVGSVYILFLAPRLLPNRTALIQRLGAARREYLLEMLVQPTCPLIGKTVEAAGLRNLPGLFLIEIDRDGDTITPVTPEDVIQTHDRMIFTGLVTTIADLERIPGLVPAADLTYEFQPAQRTRRHLTEVVLSPSSPLIDRTVREANFRKLYNAAVVAVHRNGERLTTKIGDIRLEVGDTLLLQTRGDFVAAHRNNQEFYLVSEVGGSSARRHDRAIVAMVLFVVLVLWLMACSFLPDLGTRAGRSAPPAVAADGGALAQDTAQDAHAAEEPAEAVGAGRGAAAGRGSWLGVNVFTKESHALAALTIAVAMIALRCISVPEARSAIDLRVLITIAAAIGMGKALQVSGAAEFVAQSLVSAVASLGLPREVEPYALFALIYMLTMFATELITNVAVVTMMLPIGVTVAITGGVDPRPFVIGVTIAASLSFITPIGYQSNLMVMGPGGYEPLDYAKVGTPLSLLIAVTSFTTIPLFWPF